MLLRGRPGVGPLRTALRWLPSVLLVVPWLVGQSVPPPETRIRDLASPTEFQLLDWETVHLGQQVGALWAGLTQPSTASAADAETLRAYFAQTPRPPALTSGARTALEHVVGQAYSDAGVARSQPINVPGLFPPVLVVLTPPPNVLVIAPRTELRVVQSTILQGMDVRAQEQLEASADSNGVSSLVAPIGGLATYPSMVVQDDTAERVLSAVAHEWLHQYLIFYPLGAGYWTSQQTREINETTAEMVGAELGGQLAASLGLRLPTSATAPAPSSFDFKAFMRETRLRTEQLLAAGDVDGAEGYMRARRDELERHGYVIRKLNQAYFALYGSYGEGYAASPANPIPGLLHALRDKSPTLGEFIVRVRRVTTVQQLRQIVR